jgi:hypothetical protein
VPLTDTAIRNAKPGEKRVRLFDGGGRFLEVSPTGGKWWRRPRRDDCESPCYKYAKSH